MATTTTLPVQNVNRPTQNWVVNPTWDMVFIIGAPLVFFVWATATLSLFGAAAVLAIFAVFNVAHHMPTFIRLYGDRDLLRRFRWSLLLGPVVPFSFAMGWVAFIILHDKAWPHPYNNFYFLFMILALWDPWHFLMQHYGFVRIYDRPNQAPRKLGVWMDYGICATWFTFIMLSAIHWLPKLLYNLYSNHGIRLLSLFDSGIYQWMERLMMGAAIGMTIVYAAYLVWCYYHNYYISYAKLLCLVITFSVMYLTYVPNATIEWFMPEWNFALGFATIGMVHVTQYLAIVWKYNRGLTDREGRAREGLFRKSFARGGLIVLCAYVAFCLIYGFFVNLQGHQYVAAATQWLLGNSVLPWMLGILLSLNFTSTLLHYYYDGFIWKIRHAENRQNLAMQDGEGQQHRQGFSWWNAGQTVSATTILFRHCLYFGLPSLILAATVLMVRDDPFRSPLARASGAVELRRRGIELRNAALLEESIMEAETAITSINRQLDVERSMVEIRPRAEHFSYIADLIAYRSFLQTYLIDGAYQEVGSKERMRHNRELQNSIRAAEQALKSRGPLLHREKLAIVRFYPGQEVDRQELENNVELQRKLIENQLNRWREEIRQ